MELLFILVAQCRASLLSTDVAAPSVSVQVYGASEGGLAVRGC